MDWAFVFSSFEGRISRKTFWIAVAVLGVFEFAMNFITDQLELDRLSAIIDLALIYPEFAVAVKRVNDRDMPILFLIAFFIGNAALDFLTVLQMAIVDGQPTPAAVLISVPFTISVLFPRSGAWLSQRRRRA